MQERTIHLLSVAMFSFGKAESLWHVGKKNGLRNESEDQ
jgi:hypothetical protein